MKRNLLISALGLLLAAVSPAAAQYDPGKDYKEAPAVAARFPDPAPFKTPAFKEGRTDFTSHDEMLAFLRGLVSPRLKLDESVMSQQGRILPVVLLSQNHQAIGSGQKPVVLIIGQQHGNEPAGGEAALALAEAIGSGARQALLDRMDIIVVPRGNPDGAAAFSRALANGIDANRDHTLTRTPEVRAIGALFTQYRPHIVLDCHEFTVAGRWLSKVGGVTSMDAMLQYATVPNLSPAVVKASSGFILPAIQQNLAAKGLSHDWYFTTDGGKMDAPVAMGGIGPDTSRNIAGLRNAISFLIETRGVGIGRAHYARRVATHVVAADAILDVVAANPQAVLNWTKQAAIEASEAKYPITVTGTQAAEKRNIRFIDPASGADKPVEVNWLSSLTIEPQITRPRPSFYVIDGSESEAIATLKRAGIALEAARENRTLAGAVYRVTALATGAKEDGRGDDTGAGQIVKGTFTLENGPVIVKVGDVLIPMNQPLSGLIIALLEPESSAGLIANKLMKAEAGQLLAIRRLD